MKVKEHYSGSSVNVMPTESYRSLPNPTDLYRILPTSTEFFRRLPNPTEFYRIIPTDNAGDFR